MSAPLITGFAPASFAEGDAPATIGQGLSFSGGSNFAGGFLRFDLNGGGADDQLTLNNASDVNASGAISVDGAGLVYLGNGSTRDQIGAIDAVENGQDGAALKINLGVSTDAVVNPSFENNASGWTIVTDRVELGVTMINGKLSPVDTTNPNNATGDTGPVTNWSYSSEFSTAEHTAGGSSLRLYNGGTTQPHGVVHGPYAYSDTFAATIGDVFLFDWKAAAGSDAYDAFGYLLNVDTGQTWTLVDETGASSNGQKPWTTEAVVIPEAGNFSFVFVAGTFDFNGGTAAGGSLYVDNIRTMSSTVNDTVLSAIASQVTFENTSDTPRTGPRNLTLEVGDGLGDKSSASADLVIINHTPTGRVSIAGSFKVGATLSVSNNITDVDGFDPAGLSYQWQRRESGVWTDIPDADDATYELTSADQAFSIRAVAKYTDDGGAHEVVASNAIAKPTPPPPPPVLDQYDNLSVGTNGADTLSGLAGRDTLQGNAGDDFLNGNQDNDFLQGNGGADTLHGGQGDDIVRGGQDDDRVLGDLGNDTLFGDLGRDVVNGGDGDDVLWGGQGANPDTADGGDTLSGEAGNDFVNGNGGDDVIDGGVGADTLHGGRGDDVVFGGDGDDVIFGNFGDDTLSGGAGADQFHLNSGGRDVITDFNLAQGDRIFLEAGATYTLTQQGADTVIAWSQGQAILTNVQLTGLTGDWIFA